MGTSADFGGPSLGTGAPWAVVEHHATIGSTNARAAEIGEPWCVVVADHQSAGRGRMTRKWTAPPGTSMAVSVTVPLPQAHIGWVPLLAGLAVAEAIESSAFLRADLKWPNDVLLPADGGGKVCGVLGEVLSEHHLAVVGAGINVSQHREQLPVETATSLALAGATRVDRSSLLQAYLSRFAFWYASLGRAKPGSGWSEPGEASVTASTDLTHLREAYRSRCVTIGQQVRLTRPHDSDLIGDAVAVDDDGRLVIETKVGRSAWAAGDVTHVRARG